MIQNRDTDTLEKAPTLTNNPDDEKSHPWRRCPKGKHFVKEHKMHIPPSEEHPDGITTVHEYCENNPSHKEELSYDEIQYITQTYFDKLAGPPTAGVLPFKNADIYDILIRGWVRYWNDIFKPIDALDANYIKALMATESGFRENPPENLHAHGLMQLLHQTFLILQETKGELSNHLIRISWNQILETCHQHLHGYSMAISEKKTARDQVKARSYLGRSCN